MRWVFEHDAAAKVAHALRGPGELFYRGRPVILLGWQESSTHGQVVRVILDGVL